MPNTTEKSGRSQVDLAVVRVWDAARVALIARNIAALAVTSGASDAQIEQATDAMSGAFNGLLCAVHAFDACAPIMPDLPNETLCLASTSLS